LSKTTPSTPSGEFDKLKKGEKAEIGREKSKIKRKLKIASRWEDKGVGNGSNFG
jgi:hypothetical protein